MSNKTKISSIGYCFEKKTPNFKTENLKLTSLGFKNIKIKKFISRQTWLSAKAKIKNPTNS